MVLLQQSKDQVTVIALSFVFAFLAFCICCIYKRCRGSEEFTYRAYDDGDFHPVVYGSPLGILSPLKTVFSKAGDAVTNVQERFRNKKKKKGYAQETDFEKGFRSLITGSNTSTSNKKNENEHQRYLQKLSNQQNANSRPKSIANRNPILDTKK
jgi:hypothetical protein